MAKSNDQGVERETLALDTKLEREFVQPLTAMRGALEILRDYPEMEDDERRRFISVALNGCRRLEVSVTHLSHAVYDQSDRLIAQSGVLPLGSEAESTSADFPERLRQLDEDTLELDLCDVVFKSSEDVGAFFDTVDHCIERMDRSWFFVVNIENNKVWPEAWVSHAHRLKKISVSYSRAFIRYDASDHSDATVLNSREDALLLVGQLRARTPTSS